MYGWSMIPTSLEQIIHRNLCMFRRVVLNALFCHIRTMPKRDQPVRQTIAVTVCDGDNGGEESDGDRGNHGRLLQLMMQSCQCNVVCLWR